MHESARANSSREEKFSIQSRRTMSAPCSRSERKWDFRPAASTALHLLKIILPFTARYSCRSAYLIELFPRRAASFKYSLILISIMNKRRARPACIINCSTGGKKYFFLCGIFASRLALPKCRDAAGVDYGRTESN